MAMTKRLVSNKPKPRHQGPTARQLLAENARQTQSIKERIAAESPEERREQAKQDIKDLWGDW